MYHLYVPLVKCVGGWCLGVMLIAGVIAAQEPKVDPAKSKVKEAEVKVRGQLPPNWGKLGLSEEQKQKIYQIQNKYNSEILRLETQVKELRAKRDEEMRAVLTEEQKKRLEEILLKKIK